jgi:hypothetical protein
MSQALELYKKDGTPTGVFYCSECQIVFHSENEAQRCHGERICPCGTKVEDRYGNLCSACRTKEWREKDAAKERERFDKAQKITEAEYTGDMVFLDDKYFPDVAYAIDDYLEGQEPEYVWACKDIGVPRASSEGIIENLLDNMWEDADSSDLNGLAELDSAIDAFNEANEGIHVYVPDYSTAILVAASVKQS